MSNVIETDRLLLRHWTREDAADLFDLCRDPDVMRYIGSGEPYTCIEQAQKFLAWAEAYQAEHGFCRWATLEKQTERIVGSCGFARVDTDEIELGYLLARPFWGMGFATEAAKACLQYGFDQLGFARVVAWTDPRHTASQHVVEKLGFTLRGIEVHDGEDIQVYVATPPNTES